MYQNGEKQIYSNFEFQFYFAFICRIHFPLMQFDVITSNLFFSFSFILSNYFSFIFFCSFFFFFRFLILPGGFNFISRGLLTNKLFAKYLLSTQPEANHEKAAILTVPVDNAVMVLLLVVALLIINRRFGKRGESLYHGAETFPPDIWSVHCFVLLRSRHIRWKIWRLFPCLRNC